MAYMPIEYLFILPVPWLLPFWLVPYISWCTVMWSDIIPAVTCDKLMAGWHVSCWSTAQSWGRQVATSYINDYCSISHRIWEWFCLAVFYCGFIMNLNSLLRDESGYRQVSNIRRTLVRNKLVDHSDVVGASPVGAAPTTSSWST